MRTVFFVVLDGLGDDPIPDLDGRTPLEAASTPHLDRAAAEGAVGICTTVGEGIAPESDIAVMSLLGYDPTVDHPGRGPIEAVGAGVEVEDGDLAWRCNFATVDEWPNLSDRRAGRDITSEEAGALAAEIVERVDLENAEFVFRSTVGHRAVLRIRDSRGPLGGDIGNTDPAYERRGSLGIALEDYPWEVQQARAVDPSDEAALRGAMLTNLFTRAAHEVLTGSETNRRRKDEGKLPANVVLCRDAGDHVPHLRQIGDVYQAGFGCFVEMPVEAGIAEVTGMQQVPVGDQPADPDERYELWAQLAMEAAADHDVLYVHIKGPDVPAHDGRWKDKLEIIEAIDRSFFGRLETEPGLLLVTADHATSCVRAAHTDQPVPLLLRGPGVEADEIEEFAEATAGKGSLGHRQGRDLMPWVVDRARRSDT